MDSGAGSKMRHFARRGKKKKGNKEMDHNKQAEKKMRRLEKALATSAAICAELEKKKQKKLEEQQRLEKEAAAIAEAVALHVLHGEDTEDSCQIALHQEETYNLFGCNNSFDFSTCGRRHYIPHHIHANYAFNGMPWESMTYGSLGSWSGVKREGSFSHDPHRIDPHAPYLSRGWDAMGCPADLIAAKIVSSLHISDVGEVDTILIKGMLRE